METASGTRNSRWTARRTRLRKIMAKTRFTAEPRASTKPFGRQKKFPPKTARRLSRSEEHTSELQSRLHLVCRLLLEKKNKPHHTVLPSARHSARVRERRQRRRVS